MNVGTFVQAHLQNGPAKGSEFKESNCVITVHTVGHPWGRKHSLYKFPI